MKRVFYTSECDRVEVELDTKMDTSPLEIITMQDGDTVTFSYQSDYWLRQYTVEFPHFITDSDRKAWGELAEKGFVCHVRFRQMIYPRLAAQITFLTVFEVTAIEREYGALSEEFL